MCDGRPSRLADRALEVLAVVLLGIATVGMASCAVQSQLWSGEGERLGALAATEHPEANRLFGLATQTISYDANTVTGYAQAVRDGDEKLKQFFRTSLMRKGFLSYLDQWEAQVKAGQSPQNLLEDRTYLDPVAAIPHRVRPRQIPEPVTRPATSATSTRWPRCCWRCRCSSPASPARSVRPPCALRCW